jgi:hypothetical protein
MRRKQDIEGEWGGRKENDNDGEEKRRETQKGGEDKEEKEVWDNLDENDGRRGEYKKKFVASSVVQKTTKLICSW